MPRPKSGKAYEVLNCRVPPGLTDRLSAYAELHSQRVRDVVAAALLVYIGDTHVAPLEIPASQVVRQAREQLNDVVKLLGSVLAPRRAPSGPTAARVAPRSDTNGVDVTPQPDDAPTLDHAKFYLGELCPRGHEWNGTGKTLKRKQGNKCMACENARKREQRKEQRAPSA